MAVITFDRTGTGSRPGANNGMFQLAVPISTTENASAQFVVYNECDSTVNLDFTLAADTHNVSTNDQAGNEIFIREGANQIIIAPLSAAVVTVGRPAVSTTVTNGVTIRPNMCRTSHGTVSANGERVIIETVVT